jgi:hypothetical protein
MKMKGTILLNYSDNTKQVEDEEKTRFLRGILDQMSVPIGEFWIADGPLSIDQKIKLRGILASYGIQVIDDLDGHMQIYVEGEKVAEWFKCTYKIKRDLRQIDPRKQFYLEMEVNCWSVFEEEEQRLQES